MLLAQELIPLPAFKESQPLALPSTKTTMFGPPFPAPIRAMTRCLALVGMTPLMAAQAMIA
jgi:hypothetical protein